MSGALGIPFGTQMGVTNGGNPKASKVYTFTITLTSGIAYQIDLRSLQNVNVIHDVQGIYFDNSANTTALKCNIATGQNITCPPQSQGVAPAYVSPGNPVFTFMGNGTVTITLLNFQTPATFWSTVSSNLPVVGGLVQVSDVALDNLIQNGAFNAATALFGSNDALLRARAGAAYTGIISTTGDTTIITGAPNSFVTGFAFSVDDTSAATDVTLKFSSTGTIFNAHFPASTDIGVVSITGLNLVGNPVGDNVVITVSNIAVDLLYTIFGGTTAII